jgi:hypothetical protein
MLVSMATTATEQLWTERVRAWRASGLDAHAFAAGKGFAGTTLIWRARELRKRQKPPPPGVKLRRLVRDSDPRPAPNLPAPALREVVVRVGGAELLVARGFDAQLVRELVRCLAEDAS